MTDQTTIRELAEKLESDAKTTATIYLGVSAVAGLALGAALGADAGALRYATAAGYSSICGFIGWSVGKSQAASLRLQAITALRLLDTT